MGKIILEFDSVEEQKEAQDALNGSVWKAAMWELDQKLRSTTKHDVSVLSLDVEASEQEIEIAEKYREIIREILTNYNLSLE